MTDPIAARVAPSMTVTQALAGASGSGTTARAPPTPWAATPS